MMMTDYFWALQQVGFLSRLSKQRVLWALQQSMAQFLAKGAGEFGKDLRFFCFGLADLETCPLTLQEQRAICRINQLVLGRILASVLLEYGIYTDEPYTIRIHNGLLKVERHPQAEEIETALYTQTELLYRTLSALRDMEIIGEAEPVLFIEPHEESFATMAAFAMPQQSAVNQL